MNFPRNIGINTKRSTEGIVRWVYTIFGFRGNENHFKLSVNQTLVLVAFFTIIVIAVVSRFWDLGGRALHYDELLHAWYSWLFSGGEGYSHTPMTHGPFLFHVTAGSFVLLGDNEITARFVPALFGVIAVILPISLRRELGILGVLSSSTLLLLSPTFLYFSRFIRNDVFMAVWSLILVAVMFKYMQSPKKSLLFIWVVVWALAFSTKETTYFLAVIIGSALFFSSASHFYKWLQGHVSLKDTPPSGALLLILVTISLALWAPLSHLVFRFVGFTLVNPDSNDPAVIMGETIRFPVETGAPVGGGLFVAFFIVLIFSGLSFWVGFSWNKKLWISLAVSFWVIWITLFTSFLTNFQGFFTGIWGSLGYWMAQQAVERAGQPWFYYILGLICYEYLLLIPAVLGSFHLLFKGTSFDRFLVYWSLVSVFAGIYAGEKMPWLLLSQILPLSLVAGRSIGILLNNIWMNIQNDPWQWAWASKFSSVLIIALGSLLALLLGLSVLSFIRNESFYSAPWFWIFASTGLLSFALIAKITIEQNQSGALSFKLVIVGIFLVLGILTVISGVRVNYSYASFEKPSELLIYSQTGQESTYAAECIDNIAEKSGLGKGLNILIGESDNFSWQWRWYFRNYKNLQSKSLKTNLPDQPPSVDVLAFSDTVRGMNQQRLDGFTKVGNISHLWWFPNSAYEDLSIQTVFTSLNDRDAWQSAFDYFFAREMNSRPYKSEGSLYVADRLAKFAINCTTLRATN